MDSSLLALFRDPAWLSPLIPGEELGEGKQKSQEGHPSTLDPALSPQSPASQKYKEHGLLPRPGKTSPVTSTTGGSRAQ